MLRSKKRRIEIVSRPQMPTAPGRWSEGYLPTFLQYAARGALSSQAGSRRRRQSFRATKDRSTAERVVGRLRGAHRADPGAVIATPRSPAWCAVSMPYFQGSTADADPGRTHDEDLPRLEHRDPSRDRLRRHRDDPGAEERRCDGVLVPELPHPVEREPRAEGPRPRREGRRAARGRAA